MSKIMLVEDDNSLREIYEARLAAEGYTVVSAKDGEEALAMALKEHPDLIIADVMMPKVSGFDMLDILRSTPETKNTKIIMMTALSQAEDKARAEKLGADRYLVKSQVTLEDVTREAREILNELDSQAAATVAKVSGDPPPPATPAAPVVPAAPLPPPPEPPKPAPTPPPPAPPEPPKPAPPPPPPPPKPKPTPPPPPPSDPITPTVTTIPVTAPDDEAAAITEPPKDDNAAVDAQLEAAAEALSTPVKKEEAEVKEQVDDFIAANPTLSTTAEAEPKPTNTTASDAVNSLTKPAQSANKPEAETEESDRAYVSTGQSKDGDSLKHTKTIEPTPDAERAKATPDLNKLLAKEGESIDAETAPPVNSVIAPNNGNGAPSTV